MSEGDIVFDNDTFRAPGSNMTPTQLETAEMARAGERSDLLNCEARTNLPAEFDPSGVHIAEVVIACNTGSSRVGRYPVVDDFDNLINPMLAEWQNRGGVVQGAVQAVYERVGQDEDSRLLTASFIDYAVPQADDAPMIGFTSEPVPSTANPMGMKGCDEAGAVGSMATVANAVLDALWEPGVRQAAMPFTPNRVWEMVQNESVTAQ